MVSLYRSKDLAIVYIICSDSPDVVNDEADFVLVLTKPNTSHINTYKLYLSGNLVYCC